MTTVQARADYPLVAHLLRRAGFGGTSEELHDLASVDYEVAVDRLLDAVDTTSLPDDLIRRYHIDQSDLRTRPSAGSYWIGRMVTTDAPFVEKVALFWHRVFATAQTKLIQGKVMSTQIEMFREYGLGSFRDMLVQLSKNPAMILFLDNQDNHRDAINENYGREILELFSMGVGNYTEEDVKECARAFTGWTVANTDYMALKMRNNTMRPYGYIAWQFKYDESDHDDGEKTFMGHTGSFNGEDIIDIIVKQPATARFISRHLYNFFVADDVQVPAWQHTPPGDPEAIKVLEEEYFRSNYNIRSMLRVLFNSDTFKSDQARFAKVKSPAEVVVGTLHLLGDFKFPKRGIFEVALGCRYMGQDLLNPPSVEGWHTGEEWIDSGSLVERVNFVADRVSDIAQPGVRAMVDTLLDRTVELDPVSVINGCLELLGHVRLHEKNKEHLAGEIRSMLDQRSGLVAGSTEERLSAENTVLHTMKMIGSSREYQFA